MDKNKDLVGHLSALLTILVWGTTFISTKILLVKFTPLEILLFRFIIGFIALHVIYPKRLKLMTLKQEALFIGAGISGVTLYFLLENIALTYTLASNVGIIIAIAPFFTALFSHWFLGDEKLKSNFFIGFVIAMAGVILINFNGNVVLKLNPLGDLLAILAAMVWAIYAVLAKKISQYGYNTVQTTRRIFFYGIICMLPVTLWMPVQLKWANIIQPTNFLNILFLGLGASALCFVTWNTAVKYLGAVKTSIYIYMVPAITIITSIIVLKEQLTWIAMIGTFFTLIGLIISSSNIKLKLNKVAVQKKT